MENKIKDLTYQKEQFQKQGFKTKLVLKTKEEESAIQAKQIEKMREEIYEFLMIKADNEKTMK